MFILEIPLFAGVSSSILFSISCYLCFFHVGLCGLFLWVSRFPRVFLCGVCGEIGCVGRLKVLCCDGGIPFHVGLCGLILWISRGFPLRGVGQDWLCWALEGFVLQWWNSLPRPRTSDLGQQRWRRIRRIWWTSGNKN